jgi:hypothetical protein
MSERKWTVMIYMAGDNNLDSDGISDLKEIKRVGSTNEVGILAQFDRAGSKPHTKRYYLRNRKESPRIKDDEVADLGETDSGDGKELTKFIKWGMEKYEAERYLVIIWGHGTGAYDEDIYYADSRTLRRNLKRRGIFRRRAAFTETLNNAGVDFGFEHLEVIAPDDDAKDFIDNVELKEALKNVEKRIDILGMDACLMSMAEVCYQVRESVGITVGSEAEEDLDGWPYEEFLQKLVDEPTMSAEKLAGTVVEEFAKMYEDHEGAESTLAACDLAQLKELTQKVDKLSVALLNNLSSDEVLQAIVFARFRAWSDEDFFSVDLGDFCELLTKSCKNDEIKEACNDLASFIESDRFVINRAAIGTAKFAKGLGIYFPSDEFSKLYRHLDFVDPKVTRWAEFVEKFLAAVAR